MYVVEVNEIERLLLYRDAWVRLLAETPNACFFQTLDWLAAYWHHFGKEQRLRALLVYDEDKLVGILPLTIKTTSTRGGKVRSLGYPLDGWGTRYGPIGSNRRIVLTEALAYVHRTAREWDVVDLDWTQSDCVGDMAAAFRALRVQPQVFARDDISVVDLTQGWDDYWASRRGRHRNNVRRAEKKLATFGKVDMLHYHCEGAGDASSDLGPSHEHNAPEADWELLYKTCEQLAERSWQGTSTTGTTLSHERVREFLRDVHETAVHLGAVSVYLLRVDGEPAAFSYNYVFGRAEFGLRMGYDPKFRRGNPGTVLVHRMLQKAFASQHHAFNLGEGDSMYKHAWRTDAIPSFQFSHYAQTSFRAQALRWKRYWCGATVTGPDVATANRPSDSIA